MNYLHFPFDFSPTLLLISSLLPYIAGMSDVETPERDYQEGRNLPLRLPPVPHRTDQLIEKIVDKQLAPKQWFSSTSLGEGVVRNTMMRSLLDITDYTLVDPHLQEYWCRRSTKKISSPLKKIARSPPVDRSSKCPLPINQLPFDKDEFFCLQTFLCGSGSNVTLENVDLFWLRDIMKGISPPQTTPANWNTLMNFNEEILANSSEHHNHDVPFQTRLINSPRSSIVLLRNGIPLYSLLHRPSNFYAKVGDVLTKAALDKRYVAAEEERHQVLTELRNQYQEVCETPVEKIVEMLSPKSLSRIEEAQKVAKERFEKENTRFLIQENRDKRITIEHRKFGEQAAEAAFEKAERNKHSKEAAAEAHRARGELLRQKLEENQRIAEKIGEVREAITLETQQELDRLREIKVAKIAEMKQRELNAVAERSCESTARVQTAKEQLLALEANEAVERKRYEDEKKRRAANFIERKTKHQAEILEKSGQRSQNMAYVQKRSREVVEMLRESIERKLSVADARNADLKREKAEYYELLRQDREQREQRMRLTMSEAERLREQATEELRARTENSERLLQKRLRRVEIERKAAAEERALSMNQKTRVVAVNQMQAQFQTMRIMSRLSRQDEEMEADAAMQAEIQRLALANKKSMTIRRDYSRAENRENDIIAEKLSYQKMMQFED